MFGATFGIFYCLGWCRATVWQFSSMLCGFGRHLWAACRGAMHASDVRLSGQLHGFFRCDFGYLRHILGHLQVFSVISMAQVAICAPFKQCSVILGKIKEHCLQWPLFRHVAFWGNIQAFSVIFGSQLPPFGHSSKLSSLFLFWAILGSLREFGVANGAVQ